MHVNFCIARSASAPDPNAPCRQCAHQLVSFTMLCRCQSNRNARFEAHRQTSCRQVAMSSISLRSSRASGISKPYYFGRVMEVLEDIWYFPPPGASHLCASREQESDEVSCLRDADIQIALCRARTAHYYQKQAYSSPCSHAHILAVYMYQPESRCNLTDCNKHLPMCHCRSPENPDGFILTAVAENGASSPIILVRALDAAWGSMYACTCVC